MKTEDELSTANTPQSTSACTFDSLLKCTSCHCDVTLDTAPMDESSSSNEISATSCSSPIIAATPLQRQLSTCRSFGDNNSTDLSLQIQVAQQTAAEMAKIVNYWSCRTALPATISSSSLSSLQPEEESFFDSFKSPSGKGPASSSPWVSPISRKPDGISSSRETGAAKREGRRPSFGISLGMEISLNNMDNTSEYEAGAIHFEQPLTPSEASLSSALSGTNRFSNRTLLTSCQYSLEGVCKNPNDTEKDRQRASPLDYSKSPFCLVADERAGQISTTKRSGTPMLEGFEESSLHGLAWQQKVETDRLLLALEQVEMDACRLRLTTPTTISDYENKPSSSSVAFISENKQRRSVWKRLKTMNRAVLVLFMIGAVLLSLLVFLVSRRHGTVDIQLSLFSRNGGRANGTISSLASSFSSWDKYETDQCIVLF